MFAGWKALHAEKKCLRPFQTIMGWKTRNQKPIPSGVGGIRTLEPYETVNTLAGCPYRPLRHDSKGFLTRRKRRSETKLPMMDSNHL